LGIAELFFLALQFAYLALVFLSTLLLPPLLLFFYWDYEREKRNREIDAALPSALLQAAAFPRRASMEKIFEAIASGGYGSLSEEFAIASRQVRAGASVKTALSNLVARNDSALLRRSVDLLLASYETGADLAPAFREVAEDAFELQAISRESAAAGALQKYTLLAGGALLVPGILSVLLGLVTSLGVSGFASFGAAEGAAASAALAQRAAVSGAVVLGTQVYLVLFAALAGAFVASAEGARRKAVLYFAFMAPCALLVFHALQAVSIT
jgi:pilus assembly protein TadC